jgi:hypothetical protein
MKFECEFCKKTFAKETSIEVHMCEPKRRRHQQNDRGVQLGFQAYIKFYEHAQGSARLKTYNDFCESSYYRAFVKFGNYCVGAKVINPGQFMSWLLKNNKKIDRWASDQLYTEYLTWYVTIEHVDDALRRFVETSMSWHEKTGHPAHDMLRYGNHNAVCYDITAGRISAWVIYNCDSGREFLSLISSEQLAMIWPYIDSDIWQKRFFSYAADQAFVSDALTKAGF